MGGGHRTFATTKLKPPTYSDGLHGSWTSNPTTFDLKLRPFHTAYTRGAPPPASTLRHTTTKKTTPRKGISMADTQGYAGYVIVGAGIIRAMLHWPSA